MDKTDLLPGKPIDSVAAKVLLSTIPGGCSCIIPYFRDNDRLTREKGPIWCGMESDAILGHFFKCEGCYFRDK